MNFEQSSSEATARFKAHLISKWITPRKKFCDLTGGFGVDSFFISPMFLSCDVSEPDKELLELSKQNHLLLGTKNIHYYNCDAVEFFVNSGKHYDVIYLDPSRRNQSQKKVFRFSDCTPDLVKLHGTLYDHTDNLMVKASPLLDIQQGLKDLQFVSRVVVLSVDNECKELLFLCDKDFNGEATIDCYNIDNNFGNTTEQLQKPISLFTFKFTDERGASVRFSDPQKFIYEPDASVMKGGAFKSIAVAFDLCKLQVNTHLYTGDKLINDFPGRIFEIIESVKPDRKLKDHLPEGKANIVLRNYPLSVDDLKKKTGLTDGGDVYIVGCSGVNEKFTLLARRLK